MRKVVGLGFAFVGLQRERCVWKSRFCDEVKEGQEVGRTAEAVQRVVVLAIAFLRFLRTKRLGDEVKEEDEVG